MSAELRAGAREVQWCEMQAWKWRRKSLHDLADPRHAQDFDPRYAQDKE